MIEYLEKIKENLRKDNRILIELPEGLKYLIPEIRSYLRDFDILFSGENIYGACDSCQDCDVDSIIHIGHSEIPNMPLKKNTYFVEYFKRIEKYPNLDIMRNENCKNVGLFASVQYVKELEKVKDYLESNGINAFIGTGDKRLKHKGQILGCNFSSYDIIRSVDCNIVLTDGIFHPLGLSLYSNKKTFQLNPIDGELKKINNEMFIKKRYLMMEKALNCKAFGILVSKKVGQSRIFVARKLKYLADSNKKYSEIIIMDEINNYKLKNLPFDCFINTACPRISIDDQENFEKIVLTAVEGAYVLMDKLPSKYFMDVIIEVDGVNK